MRHVPKPDRFVLNFFKKTSVGGETPEKKRKKETNHTEGGFEDKGKEETVEIRKRPSPEEGNEAHTHGEGNGEGKKAKPGE